MGILLHCNLWQVLDEKFQKSDNFIFFFAGNEASRATKNSITSAFSSIFRSKKSNSSSSSNPHSPINNSSTLSMSSNRSSISNSNSKSNLSELSNKDPLSRFGAEVRGYAMAAVILEEWLQELAAIAQEQSVNINN